MVKLSALSSDKGYTKKRQCRFQGRAASSTDKKKTTHLHLTEDQKKQGGSPGIPFKKTAQESQRGKRPVMSRD